jgi:hypothetical protein
MNSALALSVRCARVARDTLRATRPRVAVAAAYLSGQECAERNPRHCRSQVFDSTCIPGYPVDSMGAALLALGGTDAVKQRGMP